MIFLYIGIPIDVVKSKLQSTICLTTYKQGSRSVFKEMIQTDVKSILDGKKIINRFYRGTGPILVRAPIANGFCFLGYESAMYLLNYLF